MNNPAPHKAWVRKSEEDFKTVKVLMREAPSLTSAICFHSQQSIEKLLKGLLVLQNKRPPYVHDLKKLYEKLDDVELTEADLTSLEFLSDYAVAARYPDYEPEIEEAQKSFEVAKKIRFELKKNIENKRV